MFFRKNKKVDITDALTGKVTKLSEVDFTSKANQRYFKKAKEDAESIRQRQPRGVIFERQVPVPRRNCISRALYWLMYQVHN